jgi:hypothetical protein
MDLKERFLNEVYEENTTKETMKSSYKNCILPIEQNLNKDIMDFSTEEIRDLLINTNGISKGYKSSVFSFCNSYLSWCEDKQYINFNPCRTIIAKNYLNISVEQNMKGLMGLSSFYKTIKIIESKSNGLSIFPLLLSRYGCLGEKCNDIRFLKEKDIDVENMVIKIRNRVNNSIDYGQILTQLNIDKEFVLWYDKYKQDTKEGFTQGLGTRKSEVNFIPSRYVIKKTDYTSTNEEVVSNNTILNWIYRNCSESSISRISLSKMVQSRKLDMLLSIREQRKLNYNDFVKINKQFNYNAKTNQGALNLRKFWENISDEQVVNDNEIEFDKEGKQFVEELKINIGFI